MGSKHLYAMPTTWCNLSCPHCDIKNQQDSFNRDKFLKELNEFDGSITLFGGECTSNTDRMFDIIENNKEYGISKIGGVSTNLTILNEKLIEYYKEIKSISTSWNPNRFNDHQYNQWINNCKILNANDIKYRIMITLTDDLFEYGIDRFLSLAATWFAPSLTEFKFEHYVGDSTDVNYYDRADEWLCQLYRSWNLSVSFEMLNRLSCWHYDCSKIYTLYPDGTIVNRCPHVKSFTVAPECFECDMVEKCRPCRLQPHCSYPKKLAKLLGGDIR